MLLQRVRTGSGEGTDWLNHSMYSTQIFSNTKHIEAWSSLTAITWQENRFCALCLEKHVSVLHNSMMHFLCNSTNEITIYLPDCQISIRQDKHTCMWSCRKRWVDFILFYFGLFCFVSFFFIFDRVFLYQSYFWKP